MNQINPQEIFEYEQIIKSMNFPSDRIPGNFVQSYMSRTSLSRDVLKDIWNLCKQNNEPTFTKAEFIGVLHLVKMARNNVPLPAQMSIGEIDRLIDRFNNSVLAQGAGMQPVYNQKPVQPSRTPQRQPSTQPLRSSSTVTPTSCFTDEITNNEKLRYMEIFETQAPTTNNTKSVNLETWMQIHLTNHVPPVNLEQIFKLADIHKTGFLTREEFLIAMHVCEKHMIGVPIPAFISYKLKQSAKNPPTPATTLPRKSVTFSRSTQPENVCRVSKKNLDQFQPNYDVDLPTTSPASPSNLQNRSQSTTSIPISSSVAVTNNLARSTSNSSLGGANFNFECIDSYSSVEDKMLCLAKKIVNDSKMFLRPNINLNLTSSVNMLLNVVSNRATPLPERFHKFYGFFHQCHSLSTQSPHAIIDIELFKTYMSQAYSCLTEINKFAATQSDQPQRYSPTAGFPTITTTSTTTTQPPSSVNPTLQRQTSAASGVGTNIFTNNRQFPPQRSASFFEDFSKPPTNTSTAQSFPKSKTSTAPVDASSVFDFIDNKPTTLQTSSNIESVFEKSQTVTTAMINKGVKPNHNRSDLENIFANPNPQQAQRQQSRLSNSDPFFIPANDKKFESSEGKQSSLNPSSSSGSGSLARKSTGSLISPSIRHSKSDKFPSTSKIKPGGKPLIVHSVDDISSTDLIEPNAPSQMQPRPPPNRGHKANSPSGGATNSIVFSSSLDLNKTTGPSRTGSKVSNVESTKTVTEAKVENRNKRAIPEFLNLKKLKKKPPPDSSTKRQQAAPRLSVVSSNKQAISEPLNLHKLDDGTTAHVDGSKIPKLNRCVGLFRYFAASKGEVSIDKDETVSVYMYDSATPGDQHVLVIKDDGSRGIVPRKVFRVSTDESSPVAAGKTAADAPESISTEPQPQPQAKQQAQMIPNIFSESTDAAEKKQTCMFPESFRSPLFGSSETAGKSARVQDSVFDDRPSTSSFNNRNIFGSATSNLASFADTSPKLATERDAPNDFNSLSVFEGGKKKPSESWTDPAKIDSFFSAGSAYKYNNSVSTSANAAVNNQASTLSAFSATITPSQAFENPSTSVLSTLIQHSDSAVNEKKAVEVDYADEQPSEYESGVKDEDLVEYDEPVKLTATKNYISPDTDFFFNARDTLFAVARIPDHYCVGTVPDAELLEWVPTSYFTPFEEVPLIFADEQPAILAKIVHEKMKLSDEERNEIIYVIAHSDYSDSISFKTGDVIQVESLQNDTYCGFVNGVYSHFPAVHVTEITADDLFSNQEVFNVLQAHTKSSNYDISVDVSSSVTVYQINFSGWALGRNEAGDLGWLPPGCIRMESRDVNDENFHKNLSQPIAFVECLDPYDKQMDDELTFKAGDIIEVYDMSSEWWFGRLNGVFGVFPSNFVSIIPQTSAAAATTSNNNNNISLSPPQAHTFITPSNNGQQERSEKVVSIHDVLSNKMDAVEELISTESKYLYDLNLTLDIYYNPMLNSGVINKQELADIFLNWRELMTVSAQFSCELQMWKKEHRSLYDLAALVERNFRTLDVYFAYFSFHNQSVNNYTKLLNTNSEFRALEKACMSHLDLKEAFPLLPFLIKPLQRLTKYPLLMREIIRSLPETNPVIKHFKRNYDLARNYCDKANDVIRQQESMSMLVWLQDHLTFEVEGRNMIFSTLISEGIRRNLILYDYVQKKKSNKSLLLIIFNDFLVFATHPSSIPRTIPFADGPKHCFSLYKEPIHFKHLTYTYNETTASNEITLRNDSRNCTVTLKSNPTAIKSIKDAIDSGKEDYDRFSVVNHLKMSNYDSKSLNGFLLITIHTMNKFPHGVLSNNNVGLKVCVGLDEDYTDRFVYNETSVLQVNASMTFSLNLSQFHQMSIQLLNYFTFFIPEVVDSVELTKETLEKSIHGSSSIVENKRFPFKTYPSGFLVLTLEYKINGVFNGNDEWSPPPL